MANLEGLQKQRANLKRSFTRMKTFVNGIKLDSALIDELQVKQQRVEEMFREFKKIEKDILALDIQDESQAETFEELYFYILTHLKKTIREITTSNDPNVSVAMITGDETLNTSRDGHFDIKLPKINIKPFNGEYTEWQTFYEMFSTSIHNSMLQPIQKFQYLMSLLKEKPARLLKHIPITEANYLLALNKLKARYDRKKYTVEQFIQTFMEQPTIVRVNADNIHQLHDVSDEVIRGLKGLGEGAEARDPWLLHILVNKLDMESRNLWAQRIVEEDYPTIDKFFEFLQSRADALDTFAPDRSSNSPVKPPRIRALTITFTCSVCHTNQHQLFQCGKFQDMNVEERRDLMQRERRCFNCLADNHVVYQCKSRKSCRHCRRRHHSLLHVKEDTTSTNNKGKPVNTNLSTTEMVPTSNIPLTNTPQAAPSSSKGRTAEIKTEKIATNNLNASTCMQQSIGPINTFLPTALVHILDSVGQWQKCRVLLDSGSESSFIAEHCIQRLSLPRESATLQIRGLNRLEAGNTNGVTSVVIKPHFKSNFNLTIKAYVTSTITSVLTPMSVNVTFLDRLNLKYLADPSEPTKRRIDLLIGAEHFFSLLSNEQIKDNNNAVIAQNTKLGWLLTGRNSNEEVKTVASHCTELIDTNRCLQQFWMVEDLPTCKNFESEPKDEYCEKLFRETTKRNKDGHYVVKLPFTDSTSNLGDSYHTAKARLLAMERKFRRDTTFGQRYREFMSEYESLGHMSKIAPNKSEFSLFLPHHGVLKETSETTKLRVVFDASSKTSTGRSLNDILAIGPTIQNSLLFILLQFRIHAVVFVADIEKMYRQVWLDPEDRKFQRILWRDNPDEPMSVFELNTITYGMSPSSFLATRVLKDVADENESSYPKAAEVIRNCIYMDDLMSGASSIQEAIRLKGEINQLFVNAHFYLRKWMSNCDAVVAGDNPDIDGVQQKEFDKHSDTTKVLGLLWAAGRDILTYAVHLDSQPSTTKRRLLSESSRLFDPLGLLSPFTIRIKMFYQTLWLKNLDWDDEIPPNLLNHWLNIRKEMNDLATIEIPRWMQTTNPATMSMHGFCDASENAYAAAIYICDTLNQTSRLLTSKTKVAPLENVSIARLELNGALILTRLMNYVEEIYQITDNRMFAWTDSKVVLDWISHIPKRWKVYVANRTSEIRETLPRERWHYVPSVQNPADCATRGLTPKQLKNNLLWWDGPEFIRQPESQWPTLEKAHITNKLEMRIQSVNMNIQLSGAPTIIYQIYERNANYPRFLRILAFIYRWYHNSKSSISERGNLKRDEIQRTSNRVYREIQNRHFLNEYKALRDNRPISNHSKLKALDPWLDESNIIRVGGRIGNAPIAFNQKYPIILHGDDPIVKGMVLYGHHRYLHCGALYLHNKLGNEFWILRVRETVKEIIRGCVNCAKQKRKLLTQKMGVLPKERVELVKPFMKVGIDFAGPIKTYKFRRRGQKPMKTYICLFVCMCTKAIHVEVVSDLSTEAFLAAFRRFIARRGLCTTVFTDNASNFRGAQRKLKELYQFLKENTKLLANQLSREHEVDWHFIPPYAPHYGGLWEASIKSIKMQLERIIGNQILTYEELETLMIQVEGMLNQRPLYRASLDNEEVLTPAHFLVGQQFIPVTEPDIEGECHRLKHWQGIQKMLQSLWKRWYREYINTLQQRTKWKFQRKNVQIGDLVLIKEDNPLLNQWKMGKITKIHPGHDELVRLVTVKTIDGEVDRAITKLCILPVTNH